MHISHYTKKGLALVFLAVFSTVATVHVHAHDSAGIENSVHTKSSTGGISKSGENGADGQDGADGADGKDGADGQDGADGSVTEGESSASIRVHSTVNGETVTDIEETRTSQGDAAVSASVHTTTTASEDDGEHETEVQVHTHSSTTAATNSPENSEQTAEHEAEQEETKTSGIRNIFASIGALFMSYVGKLF